MTESSVAFARNISKSTDLAQNGRVLRDPLSMALGAMIRGLPGSLLFVWGHPAIIPLTNIFVFEHLDVAWLDANGRVVDVHKNFAPWTWRIANRTAALYVLELPAGALERSKTSVGDKVAVRDWPPLAVTGYSPSERGARARRNIYKTLRGSRRNGPHPDWRRQARQPPPRQKAADCRRSSKGARRE